MLFRRLFGGSCKDSLARPHTSLQPSHLSPQRDSLLRPLASVPCTRGPPAARTAH
jgi:hypothetical protein